MTTDGDRQLPSVQRVPARTRGALVTAALVTMGVALLIAKPWANGTTSAAASPTPLVMAAEASPSPTAGEAAIYTVEVGSPGGPVRCLYSLTEDGTSRLSTMSVPGPRAYVAADRASDRTRDVAWRVELLANRQETLFTADWVPVVDSGLQLQRAVGGAAARFTPMDVALNAATLSETAVLRARVILEWYAARPEDTARFDIVMPTYVAGASATGPQRESCPVVQP